MPSGWYIPLDKLSVHQTVRYALLGAMTFAAKYVMSGLPNIEPVSLLVMVFAVVLGRNAIWPIGIYVAMEFLFYGLGLWNLNYLYIWGILAWGAWAMRASREPLHWALLSGSFGLLFGFLCMPADILVGGFGYAAARWVSGIPFDLTHCIGNFCIALVLFMPARKLLERLSRETN